MEIRIKMEHNSEIKFPCGLESKQTLHIGKIDMLFSFGHIDIPGDVAECPLHGKDCPPK